MKRTLLQSAPVFRAYREWYNLRDEVVAFLGCQAFDIFAYAISSRNGCLLCSTYFRKALADIGLSPDTFVPTGDEQLLIETALGNCRQQGRRLRADMVEIAGAIRAGRTRQAHRLRRAHGRDQSVQQRDRSRSRRRAASARRASRNA